jgi:hypothetical protein
VNDHLKAIATATVEIIVLVHPVIEVVDLDLGHLLIKVVVVDIALDHLHIKLAVGIALGHLTRDLLVDKR